MTRWGASCRKSSGLSDHLSSTRNSSPVEVDEDCRVTHWRRGRCLPGRDVMTGEKPREYRAEDGPALGRIGDAEGLVEVALQGFEGQTPVFGVLEPGVVGLARGLPREGLLTGGLPGAGVGLPCEFANSADEFLGPSPVILPAGREVGMAGEAAKHLMPHRAGLVPKGVEPPQHAASEVILADAHAIPAELGSPLGDEFFGCPRLLEELEEAGLGLDEPRDRIDEEFEDVWRVVVGAIECRS